MKSALEFLWEQKWLSEDEEWFVKDTWSKWDIDFLWWDGIPHITHNPDDFPYDFMTHPSVRREKEAQREKVSQCIKKEDSWDKKQTRRNQTEIEIIESQKKVWKINPEIVVATGLDVAWYQIGKAFLSQFWK